MQRGKMKRKTVKQGMPRTDQNKSSIFIGK
jgi:hypothetical protein